MSGNQPLLQLEQRQQQHRLLLPLLRLLAVPTCQMEEVLLQETQENPAIELEDAPLCPTCGVWVTASGCPLCRVRTTIASEFVNAGVDVENLPATPATGRHALVRAMLEVDNSLDERVVRVVIGSLDDFGYLHESDENLAALAHTTIDVINQVLKLLREVAPPGVGARSLQEALLGQLDALPPSSERDLARRCLTALLDEAEDALEGLTAAEIETARRYVRRHLRAHPIYLGQDEAQPIRVDVVFFAEQSGYSFEIVEWSRYRPTISSAYLTAARECKNEVERSKIADALAEARLFFYRWEKSREVLRRIVAVLATHQQGLLGGGAPTMLSATQVAQLAGVHPSTVRRATAGRYALLPHGVTAPLSSFLVTQAMTRRAALHSLLENYPNISDRQASALLGELGLCVPRRSVAYHRLQLNRKSQAPRFS